MNFFQFKIKKFCIKLNDSMCLHRVSFFHDMEMGYGNSYFNYEKLVS